MVFCCPLKDEAERGWNLRYDRVIGFLALLFGLSALADLAVAIPFAGLNFDAGTYVGAAWAISQGLTVYQDFPLSYPPGVPVILSILGGLTCRSCCVYALVFAIDVLNAVLLYTLMRRLETSRAMSSFLVAVHLTWVIFLDGVGVLLEPFQVLFLLLGLLAMLHARGLRAAALVGVAVGTSIMMKQYSVLFVPAFLAFCLRDTGSPSPQNVARWRLVLVFGIGLGLPFTLFVLVTGQNFWELFCYLASFGGGGSLGHQGQGISQYYRDGLDPRYGPWTPVLALWHRLWMPELGLGPFLVMGLVVTALRRSALHAFLLACFVAGLVPLCFRGFFHYPQLSAPWGILLVARGWVEFAAQRPARQLVLALACSVLVLPYFIFNQRMAWASCLYPPAYQQIRLAQDIRAAIPQRDAVWMEDLDNFYPLAQKMPTENNFEGSRGRSKEKILALSDYVLCFHNARTFATDIDNTDARLARAGLFRYHVADYDDGRFRVGRVLFYRRVKP